jgi:hypothetical protein
LKTQWKTDMSHRIQDYCVLWMSKSLVNLTGNFEKELTLQKWAT